MRRILIACTLLVLAAAAPAQDVAALINKALDEQVQLNLDTTVPLALASISQKTGVRIKEDPSIYELLPWGRDTAVKARIENKTLREAMTIITRRLGLQMTLRDQYLEVAPMPALRRLGQRANREELEALALLSTTPLGLDTDRPQIKRLLQAVDKKLEENKTAGFAVENRIVDAINQDAQVYVPRNASLADALDSLYKETKATWYPWGKNILVVTKDECTRRMLAKPLSFRPVDRGTDVLQVLGDISARTGVFFEYQPGVIQAIPAETRLIRGVFENAPAQQVLEAISAATGLKYTIVDEKVTITSAGGTSAVPPRDPAVGWIQLDNGVQLLLPSSQVPDDIKQYLRHRMQKEFAKMRQMMAEEGFKPTPPAPPATRPDDGPKDL